MGIIPQTKCRRCGAVYSSMRSRCPNCGTRKVAQSSRATGTTPGTVKGTAAAARAESNVKWQMAFGLILVIAVMLAVIVMVSTSLETTDIGVVRTTPTPMLVEDAMPVVESAPTPEPTPEPSVESIKILYMNTKDLTAEANWPTMHVGDAPINLNAMVYPLDIVDPVIEWSTDDPDEEAIVMTENDDGSVTCAIVAAKPGGVGLTASCYGKSTTIRIYCVN